MPVFHGKRAVLKRHIHASQGGEWRMGCLIRAHGQQGSWWGKGKGFCLCKEQLCLEDRQRQLMDGLLLRKGRQNILHAALEGSSSCKGKPQPSTNQPPEVLRSREWLKPTSASSASPQQGQESHPPAQSIMLEADRRERVSSATEGSTFPAPQQ